MKSLTKTDIIREIAQAHEMSQDTVGATIDAFLEAVGQSAADGVEVSLPNFGKFKATDRAPRKGRNPATGEPIKIPATRSITFRPSKALKDRMNGS
ncbi:MAG: HU family DNA-binding protein [Marinibacterium sp.]|nr:HU family DNA-binding protein [Marinibacterium sp.]